jgi:hypothetical protein
MATFYIRHKVYQLVRLAHHYLDHLDPGEPLDLVVFGIGRLDRGQHMYLVEDCRSWNILQEYHTND